MKISNQPFLCQLLDWLNSSDPYPSSSPAPTFPTPSPLPHHHHHHHFCKQFSLWMYRGTLHRIVSKLNARDAFLSENRKHHLNKILVRTRHQNGISEFVPQTSLRQKTNSGVAKCRLFSQARQVCQVLEIELP